MGLGGNSVDWGKLLQRNQGLFFPASIALNIYQPTVLLILLGLLGEGKLASDVGIIQGALIALFYSFSGNARSLILREGFADKVNHLFYLRLILVVPLAMAAIFLVDIVVQVPLWLMLTLTVRRVAEWLAELQITVWEREQNHAMAIRFILLQGLGVMPFIAVLLYDNPELFRWTLVLWAIMPMLLLHCQRKLFVWKVERLRLSEFIPHMGSSAVVAVSVYVFRILILLLAGDMIAGLLFAAFSLGGMISSVYTQALGPGHVSKPGAEEMVARVSRIFALFGSSWVIIAQLIELSWQQQIIQAALGFSLIGGGMMIRAQFYRLRILQISHKDVFVQDCLANILLIASLPFAVEVFGIGALIAAFTWSAMLNLLFYLIPVDSEMRKSTERLRL